MPRWFIQGFLFLSLAFSFSSVSAQDTVTGAFEGIVTDSQTGAPITSALAEITNTETGQTYTKYTDARGRFYQGLLRPGIYRIRVSYQGFQPRETLQRLHIARTGEVVPVPVSLDPLGVSAPVPPATVADTVVRAALNTSDASRGGSFAEDAVVSLPLGGVTLTRTFDELALLLPGVAPPPQTLGSVAGPGQGAGVGTAGQFAVNGLRSRGNNFTVDGSDNNDEDIGVRRQGFLSLVPQSQESIKEYQAITLLAPAQFGRNFGANVNAVSKSGGNQIHGVLYGFFNASQLNARNRFDTQRAPRTVDVRTAEGQQVRFDGRPLSVPNDADGEDSFTLGKFGATLGGPFKHERTFYFLSAEGQILNATQEEHFAVPTVEQRGAFNSGASAIFQNPFNGGAVRAYPTSSGGDAFFSLFPFPNNPQGVYGANTYTKVLPASARGLLASGKLDHNFKIAGRAQSVTGRYNFTDDWRELPKTGEALFATLRPETRAQNFSFFLNSQLSGDGAPREMHNQVRLSYGRTRLDFQEVRPCRATGATYDNDCLLPSDRLRGERFLLNRPLFGNAALPATAGQANRGPVDYERYRNLGIPSNTESATGPLGQVFLAGFSPLGVDVYNFPQERVNNTYQAADVLTVRAGNHNLVFGADVRRSELNSNLQRLFRPLITFNGAPRLEVVDGRFRPLAAEARLPFIYPQDLAAVGAASNVFLALANQRNDARINLRFYQFNFFAQDHWRLRNELTLAYGLRYEYNTPPREVNGQIERTFNADALNLAPGLRDFVNGRTQIYEADRNNFAPRVSLAYAPNWFGRNRRSVLRGGFGVFYDQALGAVVSQSRNVYPNFLAVNFSGLLALDREITLSYSNPATTTINNQRLVAAQTLNRLNLPLTDAVNFLVRTFPNALGATLPTRQLAMPAALHYSFAFEQQFSPDLTLSFAYAGTQGRQLLRFTTPNFGPGVNVVPVSFAVDALSGVPRITGRICTPSSQGLCAGRLRSGIGAVNQYETSASSRYDSLQIELRARLRRAVQLQAAYVFSSAWDDVSDVFDLAGAFALPQNSLNLTAERGPANFDIRQRATYALVYELPTQPDNAFGWLLNGLQLTSTGRLQTGQPFTVNSIFDVNLDGNLTDRLNSTAGLLRTRRGRQPIVVHTINSLTTLLAAPGQDGRIGRNTFRAGGLIEVDLAASKAWQMAGARRLLLRIDAFNLFNRANYGIPVRLLEAPGFGRAVNTVTPGLRVQLGLKLEF